MSEELTARAWPAAGDLAERTNNDMASMTHDELRNLGGPMAPCHCWDCKPEAWPAERESTGERP